jgi:hypothetical protein
MDILTIDDLRAHARVLNLKFSSMGAYSRVMRGVKTDGYSIGPIWTPPARDVWPTAKTKKTKKTKGKGASTDIPEMAFTGDRCLAQSIAFMVDALNNFEMVSATSACDGGRLYEATKV